MFVIVNLINHSVENLVLFVDPVNHSVQILVLVACVHRICVDIVFSLPLPLLPLSTFANALSRLYGVSYVLIENFPR